MSARAVGWDQEAGLAVCDDLGQAADAECDHWPGNGHRLEHRHRQRLDGARQAHDVGGVHDVHGVRAEPQDAHGAARLPGGALHCRCVRPVTDDEAVDGRLGGVRCGHLLHEHARSLLRAKRGHQHRQEGIRVDAELGSKGRAVAHRRIVGDAVWDHTDRVAAGTRRAPGVRSDSRPR